MNLKLRQIEETQEDFERLVGLLTSFANEHEMGKLSGKNYNFEKGLGWIINGIKTGGWVLLNEEDQMVGSIALNLTSLWYSDQQYYADAWFYILPEYRKSKGAAALLSTAQMFAEDKGLPLVMNIFNMENTEAKIKLLQRKGFKLIGGTFVSGE